jgi:hypothetical protein
MMTVEKLNKAKPSSPLLLKDCPEAAKGAQPGVGAGLGSSCADGSLCGWWMQHLCFIKFAVCLMLISALDRLRL